MSEVQFEDKINSGEGYSFKSRKILGDLQTPSMVSFSIRFFHFKNEKNAGIFLIWVAIIFTLLASFFTFKLVYKGNGEVIVNPNVPQSLKGVLP